MTDARELLYSALSPGWTIETGRTSHPDGTVTVEAVTVESVVDAIEAQAREQERERIRAGIRAVQPIKPGWGYWSGVVYAILDAAAEANHDCLMPSACGLTGFYCSNAPAEQDDD